MKKFFAIALAVVAFSATAKAGSFFPRMSEEQKLTLAVTIKIHGQMCPQKVRFTYIKILYPMLMSETTDKVLAGEVFDNAAKIYDANPSAWCKAMDVVLKDTDSKITKAMVK